MIVTVIMAFMAMIGSRSVKTAMQNKKKIDARLKTETVVFDALRLMSTDIEKAFHYQYTLFEMERQAVTKVMAANPPQPGQPNPMQNLVVPERRTQLIGKSDSLHFTTINHQRTTANAQEGNQIEVGYYLNSCKSRISGKSSTCLWRRYSIVIDNDVTRDGVATPLVENVTQLKFEYMSDSNNNKEWRDRWLTDANGDNVTQNMFPYLVRITLEVHDKESKDIAAFKQTVVSNIRFTNNQDPAKRFASLGGGAVGGGANAGTNAGTNSGALGGGATNIGTLNSGGSTNGPGSLLNGLNGGSNGGGGGNN